MIQAYWLLRDTVLSFLRNEDGAEAFEYLLFLAGVIVVVLGLIAGGAPNMATAVIDGTCAAIDTILPGPALDCTP